MRSPLTPILLVCAICAAILGMQPWVAVAIAAALLTELIAVPRPPA